MAKLPSKSLKKTSQTKSTTSSVPRPAHTRNTTLVADMTECAQVEDTETEDHEDDDELDTEEGGEENGYKVVKNVTEDEDDDESESSDASEGSSHVQPSDLQEALGEALDESNFEFHGSFYHGSLLTGPPSPCLIISGLGLVGLPLSERDAKAIISCSSMAPFGQGERLVIDKDVRDTWEIEASSVSFGNPTWLDYVNKTLCAQICKSLGLEIGSNPPRMELYKLLLYETGSHFLPHQDTQKADGMFATAVILLPSAYTGGEVIVSHASSSKTIDFANDSMFSMALLAWYTDVKHEVKPVASGYRLALSYNLIHVTPPGVPPPHLPDTTDNIDALRRVLTKWRDNQFESSPNFMAYMLDHKYSPANLSKGFNTLKGADLHRVSFLRPIAEELGFKVGLARLDHNVSGQADEDYGYRSHRRVRYPPARRYGDDTDEEDEDENEAEAGVPGMIECESTTNTTISGLVDMDGKSMLSAKKVTVPSDCLMPNNPFKNTYPDEKEYEGYQGNYPGQVDHWYRRTAFFLMHENRIHDVFFSVEGAPYAFLMLQKSTAIPPSADDRRWATRLLEAGYSMKKEQILLLLNLSLKWKDVELWKATTNKSACVLTIVDSNVLFDAMKIFSFDAARLSFENLLARSLDLAERLNFLSQLLSEASPSEKKTVNTWYQREVSKILSAYRPTSAIDVPTTLSIIRVYKLDTFIKTVVPNIIKERLNYGFCIAFMKALSRDRQSIIERESSRIAQKGTAPPKNGDSSPSASTADIIDALIKKCLQMALYQWNNVGNYDPFSARSTAIISFPKVDRIIEILDQALSLPDLETCRALFIDLLKSPGTSAALAERYKDVYTPLIPRLRAFLATKNLQLLQPPFGDFVQIVIGVYLRDMLGKKGQLSNVRLRKIGCGCGECQMLNDFILGSRSSILIRVQQPRRVHLEKQASTARDLCTFVTVRTGRPHGVQLTKLPAVVEVSQWFSKQQAAKKFLASIGSESEISRIMGTRYADVMSAVDGTRPFVSVPATLPDLPKTTGLVPTAMTGAATTTAKNTTTTNPVKKSTQKQNNHSTNAQPGPGPSSLSKSTAVPVPPPSTDAVPEKLAGKKRKAQPKAHLGTIDLTDSPSGDQGRACNH